MTSDEAIRLTRKHIEGQFPKTCTMCGARYENLAAYLRGTTHVGAPVSFDVAMGDLHPREPAGTFSLANCACGTTLSISSEGMSLVTLWRLLGWLYVEALRRRVTVGAVLKWVRAEIDRRVLSEADERDLPVASRSVRPADGD